MQDARHSTKSKRFHYSSRMQVIKTNRRDAYYPRYIKAEWQSEHRLRRELWVEYIEEQLRGGEGGGAERMSAEKAFEKQIEWCIQRPTDPSKPSTDTDKDQQSSQAACRGQPRELGAGAPLFTVYRLLPKLRFSCE